jgi:hypothetical protein
MRREKRTNHAYMYNTNMAFLTGCLQTQSPHSSSFFGAAQPVTTVLIWLQETVYPLQPKQIITNAMRMAIMAGRFDRPSRHTFVNRVVSIVTAAVARNARVLSVFIFENASVNVDVVGDDAV